jgi:hypothetical protein
LNSTLAPHQTKSSKKKSNRTKVSNKASAKSEKENMLYVPAPSSQHQVYVNTNKLQVKEKDILRRINKIESFLNCWLNFIGLNWLIILAHLTYLIIKMISKVINKLFKRGTMEGKKSGKKAISTANLSG